MTLIPLDSLHGLPDLHGKTLSRLSRQKERFTKQTHFQKSSPPFQGGVPQRGGGVIFSMPLVGIPHFFLLPFTF